MPVNPLVGIPMLVATTLLPLNGHRCLESFFQVGNNIAVQGSTYQNEPHGSRTLIPTFRNEIIKIDKLVDVNSRKVIGFLYFFGDGERFVSGRSSAHPNARRVFQILLDKYRPQNSTQPQFATLFPARRLLTDRALRGEPCVPYVPSPKSRT